MMYRLGSLPSVFLLVELAVLLGCTYALIEPFIFLVQEMDYYRVFTIEGMCNSTGLLCWGIYIMSRFMNTLSQIDHLHSERLVRNIRSKIKSLMYSIVRTATAMTVYTNFDGKMRLFLTAYVDLITIGLFLAVYSVSELRRAQRLKNIFETIDTDKRPVRRDIEILRQDIGLDDVSDGPKAKTRPKSPARPRSSARNKSK
jgi:hypothetical protein